MNYTQRSVENMSEQKAYQTDYYQRHGEEIRLRRAAKRRDLTVAELRELAYHQVERLLDKADSEAERLIAYNYMRTGYSLGGATHEEAAAEIVARRLGIWRAKGIPDTKEIHLWYAEVLERNKLNVRAELRSRGV